VEEFSTMPTAKLPGVLMRHDERGRGDPCVLLHPEGVGVDSRALAPAVEALSQVFRAYTPEQRAHGRTPDVDGPVSYELMAQDTIMFIEGVIGQPVFLLGVSDGAVVALMVARRRPDLVRRLVFVAGVFHRDGWEEGVLDGEPPAFLRQSYGEISPDRVGHYDVVAAKLAAMHAREPGLTRVGLHQITPRTLVMAGGDDEVRLEHAIEMYRHLPDAELAVVPGTSHGRWRENRPVQPDHRRVPDQGSGADVRADPPGRKAGIVIAACRLRTGDADMAQAGHNAVPGLT
jgi:pimeloyl-ACP methyl ester carboxylesterase